MLIDADEKDFGGQTGRELEHFFNYDLKIKPDRFGRRRMLP